ncbi:MAG: hypothetical protein ACC631_03085, partial [Halocynthiibacter sp.]
MNIYIFAIVAVVLSTLTASADQPWVLDPLSGNDIAVNEIDWQSLTEAEKRDVLAQIKAQGQAHAS